MICRGVVEDTRLEAKAKDTKKFRGQGQGLTFPGQTISRPKLEMLEVKDQGHNAQVLSNKKKGLRSKNRKLSAKFRRSPKLKKVFKNFPQGF